MTPDEKDEEILVERAAAAYRPRPVGAGELRYSPAWHDLGDEGRAKAFELAKALRAAEAALDPEGLSTTARAVLARITR